MFIDASALCAILLNEPEKASFERRISEAEGACTSPVAVWETVRAVVRETTGEVQAAHGIVQRFLDAASVTIMSIGAREQHLAIEAFERFGKSRHPAGLNMGDCFAYACARSLVVPLLYKGADFLLTDVEAAWVAD